MLKKALFTQKNKMVKNTKIINNAKKTRMFETKIKNAMTVNKCVCLTNGYKC